jgi:eukaryotic-like serine/threonine-protein kinase
VEAFGDYDLIAPLAKGGMAELFRAIHRETGAVVVVKRLLPEMEARPDIVDLFLTEADVGHMLRHENVVRVIDGGDIDGKYFLVMEFVDGLDAERLIADARRQATALPRRVVFRIAIDALRGLHSAHVLVSAQGRAFGLVHRDVSPDNLFVNTEGLTKITDFGIAKLAQLEGQTQAGLIKGKLTYMSPEQVKGLPLDGRADAYALALVLYEMLSGVRPFSLREGESEIDVLLRVRDGKIRPIRSLEPELPRDVTRIIDKALRVWRFWRWPTCAAFADALEVACDRHKLLGGRSEVAEHLAMVQQRMRLAASASLGGGSFS